jgi:hypothetical protein
MCPDVNTGRVTAPERIDCVGACRDGRCDGRCPHQGDHVTVVGEGSNARAILRNDSDGRVYACAIPRDAGCSPSTGCPSVGQTGTITSLGLQYGDGRCTGSDIGTIVVDMPPPGGTLVIPCGIVPVCLP